MDLGSKMTKTIGAPDITSLLFLYCLNLSFCHGKGFQHDCQRKSLSISVYQNPVPIPLDHIHNSNLLDQATATFPFVLFVDFHLHAK